MPRSVRITNLIAGVLFLFISIYAAFLSYELELGTLSSPEAGFIPLLVSVLLFLSSSLFLILALRKREGEERISGETQGNHSWRKVFFFLLISAGYLGMLRVLGFWIDTFLILILLRSVAGSRSLTRSLIFSTVAILSSYFVFQILLKSQFPPGILSQDMIWKFFPTF
jgi:putative tricarboxylic transport membrane protein